MAQVPKSKLPVYQKNTLEFVAVAKSYCDFADQIEQMDKPVFIDMAVKILPLLYLKGILLPDPNPSYDQYLEAFATEEQYLNFKQCVADLMGSDDVYLDVFHPDIQFSDTPVANFVSENLADIWQDMYQFISVFKIGYEDTMNEALRVCKENFENYWGQSLVNVLRALHRCKFDKEHVSTWGEEGFE